MLQLKSLRQTSAAAALVAGAIAILWIGGGCLSQETSVQEGTPATQPVGMSTPSGSQLWAENCTRCHNVRPPQYYSDGQWNIIVHHMRERANLTGQEQREITKLLQASN